jgi:hypothetical protein
LKKAAFAWIEMSQLGTRPLPLRWVFTLMLLTVMSPATKFVIASAFIPKFEKRRRGVDDRDRAAAEATEEAAVDEALVADEHRAHRDQVGEVEVSARQVGHERLDLVEPLSVTRRATAFCDSDPSAIDEPRITTTRAFAALPFTVSTTRARIGLKMSVALRLTLVVKLPLAASDTGVPFTVSWACAMGRLFTVPVTVTELAVVKMPWIGAVIVTENWVQTLGCPRQTYPDSTLHAALQPSPTVTL